MDIHATEDEQAEAVKKWIKENGAAVIVGAVLGLGSLFGWRYWQGNILNEKALASSSFDNKISQSEFITLEDLEKQALDFSEQHSNTVYNNFLQLRVAKKAVESNNFGAAIKALNLVLADPAHESVAHVARLRLARLLIADNKAEEALNTLNSEASTYKTLYAEVKGDAYAALGDMEKAKKNYLLAGEGSNSGNDQILKMKIDALTGAVPIQASAEKKSTEQTSTEHTQSEQGTPEADAKNEAVNG